MFCPNCGAQNQDTATACAKCGFALKAAAAAPKFKGTMLMMNAPTAAKPAAAPAAPAGAPPGAPPAAVPPAATAAPAAAPAVSPKPKLKGTMIGVAPPSMGSNTGPAPAPAAPPPQAAPPPDFGAPPQGFGGPPADVPAPPGFGAPPQGFGAPPQGFGGPPAGAAPPAHSPSSAVNPLGGTVVADAGAFGAGFPPAPPPGNYDMGAPPAGFGSPPPGMGDPLGATAPVMGGMATSPMPQQPPPAPMPMQQYEEDMPIPGTVGGSNPIVTVLLIVLTCGIYGIYLLVKGKKQGQGQA